MSETYEVNLLRNVHAVDSKSSVSKEFTGLKRKQAKDNRKKRGGYAPHGDDAFGVPGHGDQGHEPVDDEQKGRIDITI
jgi:hypothetical protein